MLNPLALPIHPILVHFSIALLSVAWGCLLARYATGDTRWDDRARVFELFGVVSLPPTIVAAFVDTRGFGFLIHPRTDAPLIWHMTAALVAASTFTIHYLWRRHRSSSEMLRRDRVRDVGLATFGMIALVAAGLFAGEMVFGT